MKTCVYLQSLSSAETTSSAAKDKHSKKKSRSKIPTTAPPVGDTMNGSNDVTSWQATNSDATAAVAVAPKHKTSKSSHSERKTQKTVTKRVIMTEI